MEKIYILNIYLMILRRRIQSISNAQKMGFLLLFIILYSLIVYVTYAVINIFPKSFSFNLTFFSFIAMNFLVLPYMLKKMFYVSFETKDKSLIYTFPIKRSTIAFINQVFLYLHIFVFYMLLYLPILLSLCFIYDFNFYNYIFIILVILLMTFITLIFSELIFLLLMFIFPMNNKREYLMLFSKLLVVLYFIVFTYTSSHIKDILDTNIVHWLQNTYILSAKHIYIILSSIISENYTALAGNIFVSLGIIFIFFIFNQFLWAKNYRDGIFISNNINKPKENHLIKRTIKSVDELIFKDKTLFFQKDTLLFFRNILGKLELIIIPLAFTSITYLVNFKDKGILGIAYIVVLFLLWSILNLAFDSVKSEGGMLLLIKKTSPISIFDVIKGKIFAIRLISYIVSLLYMVLISFFGISLSDLITLVSVCISVVLLATSVSLTYSFIYSKVDDDDKIKIRVKGELKTYLLFLVLIIPVVGIVFYINFVVQAIIFKVILLIITVLIISRLADWILQVITNKHLNRSF